MEPSANPYSSPSANLFGSSSQTMAEAVPAEAITQLQGTKPWVRFMSVLMWIGLAFMLLAAGGMAILAMMGGEATKAAGLNAPMMAGLAVGYGLFAFLYIYPAVKMWQYASSISRLMASRSAEDLVKALGHQRAFWKFVGILMILIILLYIGFFIVMFSLGLAGALGAKPITP